MKAIKLNSLSELRIETYPFNHIVIDDFFDSEHALQLSKNFPEYESNFWKGIYNDDLVTKKTCQDWSSFSAIFYETFHSLMSPNFTDSLENLFQIEKLVPDFGLHGGGLHSHRNGGKLNIHLDYYTHYKIPDFKRQLNLIVYLNEKWEKSYGGHLELWTHDEINDQPEFCIKKIEPIFNRAVIFDTTQNSWHGFPEPYNGPEGNSRNSIATYYLTPNDNLSDRNRALFAPYGDQKNDEKILAQIKQRAKNY